jgi:hypothetical protein
MANFKSTLPLLILGLMALVGSVPFFFIEKPIAVSHQVYSRGTSRTEIIDHQTGVIYGTALVGAGVFILFIYTRTLKKPHDDWKRRQRH